MVIATVSRRTTDLVGGDHAGQPSDAAVHPGMTGSIADARFDAAAQLRTGDAEIAVEGLRQGLEALPYAEIWAVDFEFRARPGQNPEPVCLVAWELRSGRKLRVWQDEFATPEHRTYSAFLNLAQKAYPPD